MHIFTSVTNNYIPKARVLAESVKKFHPDAHFTLVLSDKYPSWLDIDSKPFDMIIQIEELAINNFKSWVFKHSVVEVCTAVKSFAFLEIFRICGANKVIYLDPDIVVFDSLEPISLALEKSSILLTPHQSEPETNIEGIVENEICSLKHGVFNLGFLAVRNSEEGMRFLGWWSQRLLDFCYDDIPGGLFTDQRWIDLVPCFFEDVRILREPVYNVCTWNLTHRSVTGNIDDGLKVNDKPLCFYHFSGFDSGAQELMVRKYGEGSPALYEMRQWYILKCKAAGQDLYGKTPCVYGFFDNGEPVTPMHRYLYRTRPDIQQLFVDPYFTEDNSKSYYHWYIEHIAQKVPVELASVASSELFSQLLIVQNELDRIKNSKTWKLSRSIAKIIDPIIERS